MICPRCNKPMFKEKWFSKYEGSYEGEHCLWCGEVVDEVIEENRRWNNARNMHLARLQFLRSKAEDLIFG